MCGSAVAARKRPRGTRRGAHLALALVHSVVVEVRRTVWHYKPHSIESSRARVNGTRPTLDER